MMKHSRILLTVLTLFIFTGCGIPSHDFEEASRHRLASAVWMIERTIPTDPFLLTVYERVHKYNSTANLYIEGNGLTRLSSRSISRNPTPQHPVALHMATKDRANNVVYLARPCQISGMSDPDEYCHHRYWTEDKYSPEVLSSFHQALDELKRRYGFTGFNIVGYEGGATIAGILAAQRSDIRTLRSVAGHLNDIPAPEALYDLPQHHYIGEHDSTTPQDASDQYLSALEKSPCVANKTIKDTGHEDGWANQWPDIIKKPVLCRNPDAMSMPFIED